MISSARLLFLTTKNVALLVKPLRVVFMANFALYGSPDIVTLSL
jgi:hypothetical protein